MADRTPAAAAQARILELRAQVQELLDATTGTTFVDELWRAALRAVIRDLSYCLAGKCPEDPYRLTGGMGMYHCPQCGCMTLAGVPGHHHDGDCWLGLGQLPPATTP